MGGRTNSRSRQPARAGEPGLAFDPLPAPGRAKVPAGARHFDRALETKTAAKAIIFALLLALLPISTYLYTERALFAATRSATTYAAISAVVVANVIGFAFIAMAVLADKTPVSEEEAKKTK